VGNKKLTNQNLIPFYKDLTGSRGENKIQNTINYKTTLFALILANLG